MELYLFKHSCRITPSLKHALQQFHQLLGPPGQIVEPTSELYSCPLEIPARIARN